MVQVQTQPVVATSTATLPTGGTSGSNGGGGGVFGALRDLAGAAVAATVPGGGPVWQLVGTAVIASLATVAVTARTRRRRSRAKLKEDLYQDFLRDRYTRIGGSTTPTTSSKDTDQVLLAEANNGMLTTRNDSSHEATTIDGQHQQQQSADIAGFAPSEDLIREQLARNYAFLGNDGMDHVRGAFVIVVGLGGVGSHAAHMLARSGVGRLRLIDFDQVSLSSLNRHAVAELDDVGTSKTKCLQQHIARLAPYVVVEAINKLFHLEAAPELLAGNPDFVLDCIDNLDTKIDLLKYCVDRGIRVVSSMGAGAKSDSSRVQIADISETFEDPLARRTRRGLKMKGIDTGVTVVYSTEKPGDVSLLPLEESKVEHAKEYSALPDFRVRILPVLGTLPAIFGCCMASYVVTELAGFKTDPIPVRTREKTHAKVHREMVNREVNIFKSDSHVQLNTRDVGFILDEVWRGRSAISKTFDRVLLTRWDNTKPIGFENAIAMTLKEAHIHDKIPPNRLLEHYGAEFVDFVNKRFQEENKLNKWRL